MADPSRGSEPFNYLPMAAPFGDPLGKIINSKYSLEYFPGPPTPRRVWGFSATPYISESFYPYRGVKPVVFPGGGPRVGFYFE
jgi:hypothetical protein